MSGTVSRSEQHRSPTSVVETQIAGGKTYVTTYPSSQEGRGTSISEFCTTGWRKSLKTNSVIVGAMDRVVDSLTPGYGLVSQEAPQFSVEVQCAGDLGGLVRNSGIQPSLAFDTSQIASVRSNAFTKAVAAANGGETYAGETLMSLGETMSMIRRPLGGTYKMLARIAKRKKYHLRAGRDLASATANAWMETRYGWKPLMMDLETIMNSIVGLHQQLKRRVIFRGSARGTELVSTQSYLQRLSGRFDDMRCEGSVTRTENHRAHAGVIVDIEPMSTLEMFAKVFGFRCRDLPATLWAITPMSFVVDWFADVEGWLQAVIPDPSVTVRGSWVTEISELALDYSGGVIYADALYPGISQPSEGSYSSSARNLVQITRVPNFSTPNMPALTTGTLSLLHQKDALAIGFGIVNTELQTIQRLSGNRKPWRF